MMTDSNESFEYWWNSLSGYDNQENIKYKSIAHIAWNAAVEKAQDLIRNQVGRQYGLTEELEKML